MLRLSWSRIILVHDQVSIRWGYSLFSSTRHCSPSEFLPGRKPQKLNLDSTEVSSVKVQIEDALKSVRRCYEDTSVALNKSAHSSDSLREVFTTLKVVLGDFEWSSSVENKNDRYRVIAVGRVSLLCAGGSSFPTNKMLFYHNNRSAPRRTSCTTFSCSRHAVSLIRNRRWKFC